MSPTTAIQRAEQWRKENACGEAAKVAIALLNELQALQASRAIPEGHVVVPKEPTQEMCAAGYYTHRTPCAPEIIYRAMIAAAPANKEG